MLEIIICSTIQIIEAMAFQDCKSLKKVEFEHSEVAPLQLHTIDEEAFLGCHKLSNVKFLSSVTKVTSAAFGNCEFMTEVNLSRTRITEISVSAFFRCYSLKNVSLPLTVNRICSDGFEDCYRLVTVEVPLGSNSIRIEEWAFSGCIQLANLILLNDSSADEAAFDDCELLHQRYGVDASSIVAGLRDLPIHQMCYYHSATTVQELRQCIAIQDEKGSPVVDEFGMTPIQVLLSTIEPRIELLYVLLDSHIVNHQEVRHRWPFDCTIYNWTDWNKNLLARALQKLIIDPVARWGFTSWIDEMQTTVTQLLAEDDKNSRVQLCSVLRTNLAHYETIEKTSILEMALWKVKLKSGWTSDGSKRRVLDREQCRCLSGSDVDSASYEVLGNLIVVNI